MCRLVWGGDSFLFGIALFEAVRDDAPEQDVLRNLRRQPGGGDPAATHDEQQRVHEGAERRGEAKAF